MAIHQTSYLTISLLHYLSLEKKIVFLFGINIFFVKLALNFQ